MNRDEKKGTVKKNLMRRLKTFFGKSLHQDFSTLTYIFFETKILQASEFENQSFEMLIHSNPINRIYAKIAI